MSEESELISKSDIQEELDHRRNLLSVYRRNLRQLEQGAAQYGVSNLPISLLNEIEAVKVNIAELEDDIKKLQKADIAIRDGSTHETQLIMGGDKFQFTPEWSVLRSRIQYVDANLAYKFADASTDTNVLLAFTTLFLGAFLSFMISAVLAIDVYSQTIFWTATIFCLVTTLIFGFLSKRADDRAKEVKKQLFPEQIFKPEIE